MNKDEIIIALIKDHLINTKLLESLYALKIDADEYTIYAGDTVFKLMELGDDEWSDSIYEYYYMDLLKQVHKLNIREDARQLDQLAESIFLKLSIKKLEKEKGHPNG